MAALPFLERPWLESEFVLGVAPAERRYGPTHMGQKNGEDLQYNCPAPKWKSLPLYHCWAEWPRHEC